MSLRAALTRGAALSAAFLLISHPLLAATEAGIITGPKNGTYIALGQDIADIAKTAGVELSVVESAGSIDNIKRLSGQENLMLGIVQSDVLGFLKRSRNAKSVAMATQLRMLFPLHNEEVHVLAPKEITTFKELAGKRVIVGDEGSGSLVTSVNLFSIVGVAPSEMLRMPPAEGVLAVLRGDADALIFVGGKPVRLFKNLESLAGSKTAATANLMQAFHFVALNEPEMLKEYTPARLSSADYGWLKESVPTLAVTAILMTPDFSSPVDPANTERCMRLRDIAEALRTHGDYLQQNGHPKWKEINFDARVGIWKRDICSWPANSIPAARASETRPALLGDGQKESTR